MNNRVDGIRSSAFPTLADDQIEFLRRYGEVRKIEPGHLGRIGELIEEEHELYYRAEKGELGAREHERLRQLEVNLDRCLAPRGHRRVLREAGYDPDGATVRNEKIDRRGLLAMTPQSGHEALGRSLA
jgi:uncharacterized protein DUF2630